jgi:hypothetical protein
MIVASFVGNQQALKEQPRMSMCALCGDTWMMASLFQLCCASSYCGIFDWRFMWFAFVLPRRAAGPQLLATWQHMADRTAVNPGIHKRRMALSDHISAIGSSSIVYQGVTLHGAAASAVWCLSLPSQTLNCK